MAKKQSGSGQPGAPELGTPKSGSLKSGVVAPEESLAGSAAVEQAAKPKKTPWFRITVMIVFGLVYAWDLFFALSNMLGKVEEIAQINEVRVLNGFAPNGTPWLLLLANLALPLVVYGIALWISRRRSVGNMAMMMLAGLGVVAAVSLSLIAYVIAKY